MGGGGGEWECERKQGITERSSSNDFLLVYRELTMMPMNSTKRILVGPKGSSLLPSRLAVVPLC